MVGSLGPVASAIDEAVAGGLAVTNVEVVGAIVLFGVVGIGLVVSGLRKLQLSTLIRTTRTEPVANVTGGRTALSGTARRHDSTVQRPFTGGECLYAEWTVERFFPSRGSNWMVLDTGAESCSFVLEDDTGEIRIHPTEETTFELSDGLTWERVVGRTESDPPEIADFLRTNADVEPEAGNLVTGEKRRYRARLLPVDESVFVLGRVREARAGSEDDVVIGPDPDSGTMLVSDRSRSGLATGYSWRGPARVVGGLGLLALAIVAWTVVL